MADFSNDLNLALRIRALVEGQGAVVDLGNSFIDLNQRIENLIRGLTAISGSTEGAQREFEYLAGVAQKYGLKILDLSDNYVKLIAATQPKAAAHLTLAPFDLDDPTRIDAGRRRFAKTCAGYCHGHEGTGGRAPDFKGRGDELPPELAFETISKGRQGAEVMPPWGAAFTSDQIWELVAYLKHLGRQQP